MKNIYLFLLFAFLSFPVCVSGIVKTDTLNVSKPFFKKSQWENATKDLKYPEPQHLKVSEQNKEFFSPAISWKNNFMYFLAILILGAFLYLLMRTLLVKGDKKLPSQIQSTLTTDEELNPEIPLDNYFHDAIASSDFRTAIRYAYLITIRSLAGKNLIKISRDKTNYEYRHELNAHPLTGAFDEITLHFERSWFGEIVVSSGEFKTFHDKFISFQTELQNISAR